MKNRNRKIGAILTTLALLSIFGAGVVPGETQTVTVTWIVPSDTGFSIAWAGAESEIVFNTGDRNFTKIQARSQTPSTPIINLTNNGNTAVDFHMVFNAGFATGVTYVNCSVFDNTNATLYWWTNSNETSSNQTTASSIAIGDYADYWFYSDGVNVEETAEGEDTIGLTITSVNV